MDLAEFAIIPHSVSSNTNLSDGAFILYALLDLHQQQQGEIELARDQLADELGLSTRMIGTYLAELNRAGLVLVRRTGRANLYSVVNPSRRWLESQGRTCASCGASLAARRPHARTCSPRCRQALHRKVRISDGR